MKKLILTLFTVSFVLPVFAFNFNDGNFVIDAEFEKEISKQIINTFNDDVKLQNQKKQKQEEPEIVTLIRQEMLRTKAIIDRQARFRPNAMTRAFIESQKEQKIAYEQMFYWNVPTQIFGYINGHFDISQIKDIYVNCKYTNTTVIEVKFTYSGKNYIVVYTYDPNYQFGTKVPIDIVENNI